MSREEVESGWVDGRDDGGIDGIYTLVNGHLLQDIKSFAWPKRHAELQVWVLSCKHHDTFQQKPINYLHASISELFNLSIQKEQLSGSYSAEILKSRTLFHQAYLRLAAERPSVAIRYVYASRGDTTSVAENVQSRANQVVELTRSQFSSSMVEFIFVGATELVSMHRRIKRFSLTLPVLEYLSRGQSGYVVLARLEDYVRFVTEEGGNLRRYLFDSNVRDYVGASQVNDDILESLRDSSAPDFWWLNNGVTILATGATVVGKTIQLEDIQIVNGLQTTETLYRHDRTSDRAPYGDRSVLVKIVVSTEAAHRDRIIRATNNQNLVETAALRATDKVQRDIEEHLDRHGWYYERRKNYFRNIGKPPERFVTPMYLAAGFVALLMKNPLTAAKLRARFMRNDMTYAAVFSDKTPLDAWVVITEVLKRIEQELDLHRPKSGSGERFLASWRNLLGFLVVSRYLGSFSYSVNDLCALDLTAITSSAIAELWHIVRKEVQRYPDGKPERKVNVITGCCRALAENFGVSGIEVVGRQDIPVDFLVLRAPTPEFVDRVDSELPPQPWKPGIHRVVAGKLGCTGREVSDAITVLVTTGKRRFQRDGVVYGADGRVVAVDPERPSLS